MIIAFTSVVLQIMFTEIFYTCQLHNQRKTSTIDILKYFCDLFKKTKFDSLHAMSKPVF